MRRSICICFVHLYHGGSDVFVFEFERLLLLLTIRLKGRKSKGVRSKELMGVLLGGRKKGGVLVLFRL